MTTSTLPSGSPSDHPSPRRWLRLREAARLFNLSPSYLRKGTERKKNPIPHIRLGDGGERRFIYGELCRFFGIRTNNGSHRGDRVPVALVARVSGNKQSKGFTKGSEDNDLARQTKRLEKFAEERWGDNAAISKYYGTGSGLNYERPEFIQLIGDILKGKFAGGYVVAQTFDRCCRFGIQLVKLCCQHGQCELIFTEESPDRELYEGIADEIIAIVGFFHAKTMGVRSSKTNSIVLGNDTIREIKRLYDMGTPAFQIQQILEANGHRTVNPPDGHISYYVVRKMLQKKRLLKAVIPDGEQKTSWELFAEKHLVFEGPNSDLRLKKSELYAAYVSFCKAHDLIRLSARKVGDLTINIPRRHTHRGTIALVGCRLQGDYGGNPKP